MIPASQLVHAGYQCAEADFWVVVSQTCNLYNPSFEKVPLFEVVGASLLDACSPPMTRGDDPRAIHLQAASNHGAISLNVDIHKRKWLPRHCLADVPGPEYGIKDAPRHESPMKDQWLDNLAGWMARSYTRVALPDDFNEALRQSRLEKVLKEKLAKQKDALYGIYLSIEPDNEQRWTDALGSMPPPYVLGITLVLNEEYSPKALRETLVQQIFEDKLPDPADGNNKVTRAELASREGIYIVAAGVEARSVTDITLQEMRSLIRYSLVDHLSDSSFASQ